MFSYPSKVSEKQFQKTRSAIVLCRYSEFPDTTRLRCLVTSLIQGLRMSTSQQVNVTTLLLHPSWRLTISHLREKKIIDHKSAGNGRGYPSFPGSTEAFDCWKSSFPLSPSKLCEILFQNNNTCLNEGHI